MSVKQCPTNKHCPHKARGPAANGISWCEDCNADVIEGYVVASTLDTPATKGSTLFHEFKVGESKFRMVLVKDREHSNLVIEQCDEDALGAESWHMVARYLGIETFEPSYLAHNETYPLAGALAIELMKLVRGKVL